jgi:tRNA splicing ligase
VSWNVDQNQHIKTTKRSVQDIIRSMKKRNVTKVQGVLSNELGEAIVSSYKERSIVTGNFEAASRQ